MAGVVQADFMPRLGLSFATSPIPRPDGDTLASNYTGGAAVSWEIDLWGRLRRANEASRADLLGREESRRGVIISLIADVAGRYYQLAAERRSLQVAEQTASGQEDALRPVTRLAGGGWLRPPRCGNRRSPWLIRNLLPCTNVGRFYFIL